MDSETARAFIAVMLREQDILGGEFHQSPTYDQSKTYDHYLGEAQQILESSYANYPSPVANLDR